MVDLSKVKVGDTIVRRDGEIELIKEIEIDLTDSTPYRFNNLYSHVKSGHWFSNERESTKDIIEHIPQEVQVVENIDVTKIEVGDKVIFRGLIYLGEDSAVVSYIKEPLAASPYVVCFNLGVGFYSYTTEGNFEINDKSRWDIMKVQRNGVTIMERKESTVVNSDGSIEFDKSDTLRVVVETPPTKQVYLINGKLFSTETLSTLNNLDLLKEIGVQVEVKDVL